MQGVFFRATAKKIADENKLTGWIKNRNDGNVHAIITGNKEDVEKFIEWSNRGPENAEVYNVNVTYIEETIFEEFQIKRG